MSETNQDAATRTRRTQAQMAEARGDVPISDTTLARIIEITEQRIASRPNPMSLDTFEQIEAFAERAARSQMVPKDYQGKPDNIILAVMQGKEIGLPPIQAIQSIAMVNGRPSVWGDAVPGLCYASRLLEDHQEYYEGTEGQDGFTAVCKVKRKGVSSLKEGRFSQGDAKKAGLFGQAVHGKYPKDMAMWRARHRAFHAAFPDVLRGIGIREIEAEDSVATPGWTMPAPEKSWFTSKPQTQSDGWDDTWFAGVVQKLAGEPNAWKWVDLLIACLNDAPTIRDVEEIGDLPMVIKVRETAPEEGRTAIDTGFNDARQRLKPAAKALMPQAAILENGAITPVETSANGAPAAMVAPATGERGSHDTPAAGAVAFSAWLVDHEGEGIGDDPHDKPVAWAEAYVAARDGMSDDQTEAFGINNSPALALAMGADKEVYNIVALTLPVTHAEPAATTSAFVPPPAKPTRAEYDAYQARFKETLATQTTLAGVDGFDTANLDVYGALPDKRRVECLAMISARRNEVDAPVPQSLADLAAGMEKDIASLETIEKIDAWRKYQPVMDEFTKLLQGDPDLYHSVMNVADKRRAELAPNIAPELTLYDELYARMMACETIAEVDILDADEDYRADVRRMYDLNPTIKPPLWVRLGEVGKQHKKKLEGAAG